MRTTAWFAAAGKVARHAILIAAVALPTFLSATTYTRPPIVSENSSVRLTGHVLPALASATREPNWAKWPTGTNAIDAQEITLTIVLNRDDEAGFQHYLHAVYDPASPIFRKFLTPVQIAERFGPSQQAYDETLGWLKSKNFELAEGSANRMTLTVRGARADAEHAFDVRIDDYRDGERSFHANDDEPALPMDVATHVLAVQGLSDLAQPRPTIEALICGKNNGSAATNKKQMPCRKLVRAGNYIFSTVGCFILAAGAGVFIVAIVTLVCGVAGLVPIIGATNSMPRGVAAARKSPVTGAAIAATPAGTGQTIGLLEFDGFSQSDVQDYLDMNGAAPGQIGNLSVVAVNGGVPSPGSGEGEVLLDIDAVMSIVPGAHVAVYEAPFNGRATSYSTLFNAMINGGVTVISNSWSSCEDQISLADALGIDAVLQTAAAAGISVFNASGDNGATCLDGSPNTIGVPADSPNATAVGGTSSVGSGGAGFSYGGEVWWDGTTAVQPTGQGGFGASRFFARPSYQDGLHGNAMRLIPDVVTFADPVDGLVICQADAGGCPNGLYMGGTSFAAPEWAAIAAATNQQQGHNLGAFNRVLYPLAATEAFHNAASMGSDFAHVGLGSPNINALNRLLEGGVVGIPVASNAIVRPFVDPDTATFEDDGSISVPADGATMANVSITLRDANGYNVSGKTVTLAASGSAVIAPASATTGVSDGTVVFTVTDLVAEKVTFTATDSSDGLVLPQASLAFGVPSAASSSITALTDTVAADGVSTNTITVTLQDSLGRPTPGKQVQLAGTGSSVVAAPNPGVTDVGGQVKFSVTDTVQETVIYTAIDATDGNLPVPGSAFTTFNAGGSDNCGGSNFGDPNISAAPGFAMTPYATGFLPKVTNFGGLTNGCRGASGLAFDATGNLFVSDLHTGNIYKFAPGGGVVGNPTQITPTPLGPGIEGLAFGKDGKLYASQMATTGNFLTGAVFEVDPVGGAIVRTVASPITCAAFLAIDPASGDLFVDDTCGGGGSDNPSIWRIANPGSATPTTTVYATTSGTNGGLAFAPGGTLYAIDYFGTGLSKITGTASATPGQRTQLNGVSGPALDILALGTQANSDATTLIVSTGATSGGLPAGMKIFDATTTPITAKSMLINNAYATVNLLGPDGCLYAGMVTTVYKITNADGSCPLNFNQATLTLSPSTVSPNPSQGTTQTFTAQLKNATVPAGTQVVFDVTGANPLTRIVRADQNGAASFSYSAVNAGDDSVVASMGVGGKIIATSPTKVTWNSGSHTTSLSLNPSPLSGTSGQSATVRAVLLDVSTNPLARLSGQSVTFTLDTQSCTSTTDASGVASCPIQLPAGQVGRAKLQANFSSAGQLLASSDNRDFTILGVAASLAATTTSLTASPNPVTAGQPLTLTANVSVIVPTSTQGRVAALPAATAGTVTFTDNGVPIGNATLDGGGQAVFVTSSLAVGTHSLVASYTGDTNNAASASVPAIVSVFAAASSLPIPTPALATWALALLALGLLLVVAARKRRWQEP